MKNNKNTLKPNYMKIVTNEIKAGYKEYAIISLIKAISIFVSIIVISIILLPSQYGIIIIGISLLWLLNYSIKWLCPRYNIINYFLKKHKNKKHNKNKLPAFRGV